MKKYYLHNGSENIGPFDIEELKEKKITRETPVWYEEMEDWKNASEIAELKTIFASVPPPINKVASPPPLQKESVEDEPKTHWLVSALRKTFILILIVICIVTSISYYSEQKSNNSQSEFMKSVMSVEELEAANPTDYLIASGNYKPNFLGTKLKIEGFIDNKATITAYKNVTVDIIFYNEDKTEMNRESFIINDFFPANSRKKFNHKVTSYSNVESIGWVVSNAIANR